MTSIKYFKAELVLMKPLLHSKSPKIELEVEVKDNGAPPLKSTSTVIVNIMPQQSPPPAFSSHIYTANVKQFLPLLLQK